MTLLMRLEAWLYTCVVIASYREAGVRPAALESL